MIQKIKDWAIIGIAVVLGVLIAELIMPGTIQKVFMGAVFVAFIKICLDY